MTAAVLTYQEAVDQLRQRGVRSATPGRRSQQGH